MKNFIVRTLSGAVYVSAIIASLLLNQWFFAALCLAFNVLALSEYQRFNTNFKQLDFFQLTIGIVLFIAFHLSFIGLIESRWLYLTILLPLLIFARELYIKTDDLYKRLSFKLIGFIYITLPLIILDCLNTQLQEQYSLFILLIFILIWANDTFAYLSGMLLGRHKLFERITPKKTWEGFFGGFISTILIAGALYSFSGFSSLGLWLLLAAVISIVSVFGDFVESMFKRASGLKDSGNIMPGHGGILDRIDSILFVFPVVFVYFELIK